MKKIIVIGDSNQSNLLSDVLQLVVGCVVITGQHEKLNRGYCSTTDWCGALFPSSSMEKKVPKICSKKQADKETILILQSPTNDLSNLKKVDENERKLLAEKSSTEILRIAKDALAEFNLKQVIILGRPRRADDTDLENLSKISNAFLEKLIKRESNRIVYGDNSVHYDVSERDLFGEFGDGIHLRGKAGKKIYTDQHLAALKKGAISLEYKVFTLQILLSFESKI